MKKYVFLICLFIPLKAIAVAPVITPSTSAANLGGIIQFSETAVDAGSWTCVGTDSNGNSIACRGSINRTTGLYSAPSTTSTYLPQHNYAGVQIFGNSSVYNVRIDSLPVHPLNTELMAATTEFGGQPHWTEEFPMNHVSTAGYQEPLNFHYTPGNNSTYSMPQFPGAKAENGWLRALILTDGADHHVLMIDTTTAGSGNAQLSETYQFAPGCTASAASVTGNIVTITCTENPQANMFLVGSSVTIGSFTGADTYFNVAGATLTAVTSTSLSYGIGHANASASSLGSVTKYVGTDTTGKMNSSSGIKYYNTEYTIPINGATDAAGMKVQGLLLSIQEWQNAVKQNTTINHAFRGTLSILVLASSNTWPASTFATDGSSVTFGLRVRLKGSYPCAQTFSPKAAILCQSLQQEGIFVVDGGNNGLPMNMISTRLPLAYYNALREFETVNISTSMEYVDESSIMVSTASEMTTYNREIVKFQRTSDLAISTVDVVLQGPAVNFQYDQKNFMAGAPATQLEILNNYGGFTCSMSPTVGSITSGCSYTAPSSVTNLTTTTITATSLINSSMTAQMEVDVYPSSGAFVIPSQTSNYVDSTGTTWNALAGIYQDQSTGCCACDNSSHFLSATDNTLYKCFVGPLDDRETDTHSDWVLPNGTYLLLYRYGTQQTPGTQLFTYAVNGSLLYTMVDPDVQANGQYRLFASTTTTVSNNQLSIGVWDINHWGGPISSLSIIPITVVTPPPFRACASGRVRKTGRTVMR